MPEIDLAGAQAALEAASQDSLPAANAPTDVQYEYTRNADGTFATNQASEPEAPTVAEDSVIEPAAPETTPPAEETSDEVPDFTTIDDSVLSPELQQMRRSMQADYTKKTQEAAPWRKLGQELGIDNPEDFRTAAEVYQRLQDPRNWPTIHGELTEFMQQYGMSPKDASAAASEQLAEFAPAEDGGFDGDAEDYSQSPDLAPIMAHMKAQAAQIEQLKQLVTGDQAQRAQEAQVQSVAAALTRQENLIRQQNPTYTDSDVEAVYHLMGNDGNLVAAQQKYESIIGARLATYLKSKQGAAIGAPTPLAGGGVIPAVQQDTSGMSPHDKFELAHKAALRNLAERNAAQ